ncbi:uncharacterized protein LOC142564866 isoform X2 [Dermacentor variabilis]|uniref:uncharacterized protein LOC142564866 isoform X2 n=1 Tax=Dermacentor variabilis TaxID=34621 RepID=UPI003F5BD402
MIANVLSVISLSWLVGLASAVGPTSLQAHDPMCDIQSPVSQTKSCRPLRYFYNKETGLCGRTCSSNAPFSTRMECEMSCRSVLVCFIRMRPHPCDGSFSVKVFRFNAHKRKCYARKGCTYRGNNFPTLEECMSTCSAGAGSTDGSDDDEGGNSHLQQQRHAHSPLYKLAVRIQRNGTQPIAPELPNTGGAPSIPQRVTGQQQITGATATSPAESPPLHSDTAAESGIAQRDGRCTANVSKSTPSCNSPMYYFDQNTRLCRRTCSEQAPFQSKSECDGICRSVLVCFDQQRPHPCKTHSNKVVYYFDAHKGKCFARTACTNTGNNFPTIQECKRTCGAYAGFKGQTEINKETALAPSNGRLSQPPNQGVPSQETPPNITHEETTHSEGYFVSPNNRPASAIPEDGTALAPSTSHGEAPASPALGTDMSPIIGPATPPRGNKPDTSDAAIASAIPQQDHRCSVTVPRETDTSCKAHMYYFDSRTRLCNPTCSEMAPFVSRTGCIRNCRSVLVCFVKRLPNICGGNRKITVYYYNPRKGRCFVGKGCTYQGNNFPTLGECQRTCGAFTGLEEPSEEENSNGNTGSTTEPPMEQPEEPVTEQVPSTTPIPTVTEQVPSTPPVPTIPPMLEPSGPGIVSSAPQNEPVRVPPPTTTSTQTTPLATQPFETGIMPAVPHHDSRCIIFFPGSPNDYCKARRFYFDSRRRLCMPTCSKWAPFESSSECNGFCRSVLVCFIERRNALCKTRRSVTVFYYDFHKGKCVNGKACEYRGNNFPTAEECERTCSPITGAHEPALDSGIHVITRPSQLSSPVYPMQHHPNMLAVPPPLPPLPVRHTNKPIPPLPRPEAEHVYSDHSAVGMLSPLNFSSGTPARQSLTMPQIYPAIAQKQSSKVKASPINQVATQQKLKRLVVPTEHPQSQIGVPSPIKHEVGHPHATVAPGSATKNVTLNKSITSAITHVKQEHLRSPVMSSFQQHVNHQHLSTPTLPLKKQPVIDQKLGVPAPPPLRKHVAQQQNTTLLSPVTEEATLKQVKTLVVPQTQQVAQHKLNSQVVLLTEQPSSRQVPKNPILLPAQQVVTRHNLDAKTVPHIQQPKVQEQTEAHKLSVVPQIVTQQVLTTSTATQIRHQSKLPPLPTGAISQIQAQTTQQQLSTAMGSPTPPLVTQQHLASPVGPPRQHWTAPQHVSRQMFPLFPGPLPYGFR